MRIWSILAGASGLLALGLTTTAVDVHPIASSSAIAALPLVSSPLTSGDYMVAAPGRVEPASEEIRVAGSTTGLLREVLVKAGAKARAAAAHAAVEQMRAVLDKTVVRSPIDGTVLRVHRRPGELVSTFFVDQPIVTVGDLSKLYVRAEVDETDIANVARGQSAYVTADAYGATRFAGKVVHVGEMLGQKTVHTGEPTERTDTRVLEVLIELDSPSMLRPGLRVNSFIQRPAVSARPQNSG